MAQISVMIEDVMALLSLEDRRETQDCCTSSPVPTASLGWVERKIKPASLGCGIWSGACPLLPLGPSWLHPGGILQERSLR